MLDGGSQGRGRRRLRVRVLAHRGHLIEQNQRDDDGLDGGEEAGQEGEFFMIGSFVVDGFGLRLTRPHCGRRAATSLWLNPEGF